MMHCAGRCGASLPGQAWSHDVTVRNWACLTAKKMQKPGESAEKVRRYMFR